MTRRDRQRWADRQAREALRRGWLLVHPGPLGDAARSAYAALCNALRAPEVVVKPARRFATVQLDLCQTGRFLSEGAQQRIVALLLAASTPRTHSKARRSVSAEDERIRLWARGANAGPTICWATRVPLADAPRVAAELAHLVREDLAAQDSAARARFTPDRVLAEADAIARAAAGPPPEEHHAR